MTFKLYVNGRIVMSCISSAFLGEIIHYYGPRCVLTAHGMTVWGKADDPTEMSAYDINVLVMRRFAEKSEARWAKYMSRREARRIA